MVAEGDPRDGYCTIRRFALRLRGSEAERDEFRYDCVREAEGRVRAAVECEARDGRLGGRPVRWGGHDVHGAPLRLDRLPVEAQVVEVRAEGGEAQDADVRPGVVAVACADVVAAPGGVARGGVGGEDEPEVVVAVREAAEEDGDCDAVRFEDGEAALDAVARQGNARELDAVERACLWFWAWFCPRNILPNNDNLVQSQMFRSRAELAL